MADATTTRIGLTIPENGVAATTDWGLKLNQNFQDIDEKGVWNDQANTISASTSGALLTLTQGGAGHALLVNGSSSFTARLAVSHATVDDNSAAFSNTSSSGYGLYSSGGSGGRYAALFNDKDGNQLLLLSGTGDLSLSGNIAAGAATFSHSIGVGMTASAWGSYSAVDIGGNGAIAASSSGSTSTQIVNGAYYNGTNWVYKYTGVGAARYELSDSSGGTHRWLTATPGTAGSAISFTQAMALDASGVLSYGTYTSTPGSITGYIEIKDNGGTVRKLAVTS